MPFLRVRQADHRGRRDFRAGRDHGFDVLEFEGAVLHLEPGVVVMFGVFAVLGRVGLRSA